MKTEKKTVLTKTGFRNAPRGATPLMAASRRGHSRIVELLLQVQGYPQKMGLYKLYLVYFH